MSISLSQLTPLPPHFYVQDTVHIAQKLLGCVLLTRHQTHILGGKIVEVEAYTASDPCSHSYKGQTPRNASMFKTGGHVYVYIVYGIHRCINVVTDAQGIGSAVLIRAIEPIWGIPIMQKRRNTTDMRRLCRGPGCLTQALGITMGFDGMEILDIDDPEKLSPLHISIMRYTPAPRHTHIARSPRIGIRMSTHALLRFYIKNSIFVS